MQFLIFALAVYGFCFAVIESSIFDTYIPLREKWVKIPFFRDMLSCYFCTGFYAGIFFSIFTDGFRFGNFILYPFAGAASAYLIHRLFEHFITKCTECSEKMKAMKNKYEPSDRVAKHLEGQQET